MSDFTNDLALSGDKTKAVKTKEFSKAQLLHRASLLQQEIVKFAGQIAELESQKVEVEARKKDIDDITKLMT